MGRQCNVVQASEGRWTIQNSQRDPFVSVITIMQFIGEYQNIISLPNPGHKVTNKRDVKIRENQDDKNLQFFKSAVSMWTLTLEILVLFLIPSNLA